MRTWVDNVFWFWRNRNQMSSKLKIKSNDLSALLGITIFSTAGLLYFGSEDAWGNLVMPLMHKLDAERAHNIAIAFARLGILPRVTERYKINILNVVGLAAGFDKSAECFQNLQSLGFGFIEVGTVTPKFQGGNPKPRLFNLMEDGAIINRMGFNNLGYITARENLLEQKDKMMKSRCKVGVNIGINKDTSNPYQDYVLGVNYFKDCCQYIVINVSSPNTPNLRSLQNVESLKEIIKLAKFELFKDSPSPSTRARLLVKISPDLSYKELDSIISVLLTKEYSIDGIIVSNTTIQRDPKLKGIYANETGGLSGKPLKDLSNEMIKYVYNKTNGTLPIIGVGGIFSGKDAYEKITCGASLVQIYTAFALEGPLVVEKIKMELVQILIQNNFKNVSEAVGLRARENS